MNNGYLCACLKKDIIQIRALGKARGSVICNDLGMQQRSESISQRYFGISGKMLAKEWGYKTYFSMFSGYSNFWCVFFEIYISHTQNITGKFSVKILKIYNDTWLQWMLKGENVCFFLVGVLLFISERGGL